MSNNRYDGGVSGVRHAPGVKCIVAVKISEDSGFAYELAKLFFGAETLKIFEQLDNGRVVTLVEKITPMYQCPVCKKSAGIWFASNTAWLVVAADGKGNFVSPYAACDATSAIFMQSELIPIGDESLVKDESVESMSSTVQKGVDKPLKV